MNRILVSISKNMNFILTLVIGSIVGFVVGYSLIPLIKNISLLSSSTIMNLNSALPPRTFQNIVGFCTAIGSLATFGTLCYLIYQNKKQTKLQSKQVEMWNEQKEILCFQKYQTHRDEFLNLLSSIETRYEGIFIFKHKNRLYKRLFPRNSFIDTKYDYKNESLCSDNPYVIFENVVDKFKKETSILKLDDNDSEQLKTEEIKNAVYELDLKTCNLLNLFELECIETPKLGFIHDGDFVLMNGLSPFRQIERLIDIANELRQFANMPPYYGIRTGNGFYSPIVVAQKVISHFMNEEILSNRKVVGGDLIISLIELNKNIWLIDDEDLKNSIITCIKPLDFLGHNSLNENFSYNMDSVIIELRCRLEKLHLTYNQLIERSAFTKNILEKFNSNLNIISPPPKKKLSTFLENHFIFNK